jgi:uncharacterized protein YrrD
MILILACGVGCTTSASLLVRIAESEREGKKMSDQNESAGLVNGSNFRGKVFVSPEPEGADPRPTQSLIGMPIVSSREGTKLGSVADIFIDRENLQIAGITTSKGGLFQRETQCVPAKAITVWGKDVILVEDGASIRLESEMSGRENWLSVSQDIRRRYVVSLDGTRIGQVQDVIVDSLGRVVGYEMNQVFVEGPISKSKRIPSSATHALGKDVLVIENIHHIKDSE